MSKKKRNSDLEALDPAEEDKQLVWRPPSGGGGKKKGRSNSAKKKIAEDLYSMKLHGRIQCLEEAVFEATERGDLFPRYPEGPHELFRKVVFVELLGAWHKQTGDKRFDEAARRIERQSGGAGGAEGIQPFVLLHNLADDGRSDQDVVQKILDEYEPGLSSHNPEAQDGEIHDPEISAVIDSAAARCRSAVKEYGRSDDFAGYPALVINEQQRTVWLWMAAGQKAKPFPFNPGRGGRGRSSKPLLLLATLAKAWAESDRESGLEREELAKELGTGNLGSVKSKLPKPLRELVGYHSRYRRWLLDVRDVRFGAITTPE